MKQKVALVLSSGGSKGLAHIGTINILEKNGFEITSVSGSSIGSVIGGVYAMGKLPTYTEWLRTIDKKTIWGLMDFTLSTHGILKGENVFNKMKTFIPDIPIEKMNIPFAAVATDLINEKEVVFNKGSYYEAIRHPSPFLLFFTPVKRKNTMLVDGGVLNPIPIEFVNHTKGDILVVVNLYGEKTEKQVQKKDESKPDGLITKITSLINSADKRNIGYFSLLSQSTSMIHRISQLTIEHYKPDIVINIPSDAASTFDFLKANELIELGEKATIDDLNNYYTKQK